VTRGRTRGGVLRTEAAAVASAPDLLWPFGLTVEQGPLMLNCEVDDPVYEALELQWFDDAEHGTGMLVFLQRRADRRVDYYVEHGLTVDRAGYELGGGTGRWVETTFARAWLEIGAEGVVAQACFTDVDGRAIEVAVDDRGAGRRRPGELLAPVGAGVEEPRALLLVYLYGFDLVRRGGLEPVVRIGGRAASPGRLPGAWLHRRHLIKAAGPLTVARLCPVPGDEAGTGPVGTSGTVHVDASGTRLTGASAEHHGASAQLVLEPGLPALAGIPEGRQTVGAWQVRVDGRCITGGRWRATRRGDEVDLALDVTRRWRPPPGLPPLMRIVTRVIPVFRRWPTTYRWRATVTLGDPPTMTSRWERVGTERGEGYRRATSR
jgi:hypothetical protein